MDLILDKNSIDHQRRKVKMIFWVFAVSVFWMRAWIGGGRRYDSGKHRFFEKMKDSRGFLTIPPGDFLISCFS
jgi:hypothetical protein